MSRNTEVVCDECEACTITFASHENLEEGLVDAGWSKDAEGCDICDECSPPHGLR